MLGEITGFSIAYMLFTTAMYYIFYLTNKLPQNWNYYNIVSVTLLLVLFSFILKGVLK